VALCGVSRSDPNAIAAIHFLRAEHLHAVPARIPFQQGVSK
jgi:hypothetical protein